MCLELQGICDRKGRLEERAKGRLKERTKGRDKGRLEERADGRTSRAERVTKG